MLTKKKDRDSIIKLLRKKQRKQIIIFDWTLKSKQYRNKHELVQFRELAYDMCVKLARNNKSVKV